MKTIGLDELKVDKEGLEAMLAEEQQKLIAAQNACFRFEGALTYNKQCIDYLTLLEDEASTPD